MHCDFDTRQSEDRDLGHVVIHRFTVHIYADGIGFVELVDGRKCLEELLVRGGTSTIALGTVVHASKARACSPLLRMFFSGLAPRNINM